MIQPSNKIAELRKLFAEGKNLMHHLREGIGNSQENILLSYDLQAGSYTAQLKTDEAARRNKAAYGSMMADIIKSLGCRSLLDAGTGEATSLAFLLDALEMKENVYAFDISLSRLLFAKRNLASHGRAVTLFTAALDDIPIMNAAVDIVLTNHCLEPNGGRERELLAELLRVAGRYLVLVEPSWELGSSATRDRIEEHGYVKGLPDTLASMGAVIRRHELWGNNINPNNEAALIVAEVPKAKEWRLPPSVFRSPVGLGALDDRMAFLYSRDDGYLFPRIEGVACLVRDNGILASRLDNATKHQANVTLRPATIEDAEMLFRWRNDAATRAASVNTDFVPFDGHIRWLTASLTKPDRILLVAQSDVPIGTARLDREGDTVELSWTVAPEARGKGYGTQMVRLAIPASGRVVAQIKRDNIASQKIAKAVGMRLLEDKDLQLWELSR